MGQDRVIEFDQVSDLVATTTMILSIPQIASEALVVCPGMIRTRQIDEAMAAWRTDGFKKPLLIAGYHEPDVAARELTLDALRKAYAVPAGVDTLYTQVNAANAKVQAEWVADTVRELQIKSFSLYLPAFHLVRGFLTHLASFRERGYMAWMIPIPTRVPPSRGVDLHPHQEQWDLVTGEVIRIPAYREKGDLATLQELRLYIDTMWKMHTGLNHL